MSEEQSGFKVTDRRLFNPDGTPREVERDNPPDQEADAGAEAHAAPSTSARDEDTPPASSPTSESRPQQQQRRADHDRATGSAAGSTGRAPLDDAYEDIPSERSLPGADDPASFINFLMSIASNAAASLGMMEHPVTGERGVDLQLAKHWIDVLGMLQEKTRGNLAAQEQQIFEGLLADLRMQYVSLNSTAPPTPKRGFTGRDIVGGK